MPPFYLWGSFLFLLVLAKTQTPPSLDESIHKRSRPRWEREAEQWRKQRPRRSLYKGVRLWQHLLISGFCFRLPGLRSVCHQSVFFAGQFHRKQDITHLLVLGSTGSGKSQLCNQPFLRTWLRQPTPRQTVVLVDTKGDFTEIMEASGQPYTLVDPMDLLASAWDMGADFQDLSKLKVFGQYMFPEREGDNAFFVNAAREIFLAVLTILIDTQGSEFQLSDLYNAILSDKATLKRLLESHEEGRRVARVFLDSEAERTTDAILSELAAVKGKLDIPAAHWQRSTRRFSLRRLLQEGGTLVVRFDVDAKETTFPLGKFLLSTYIDLINALPDHQKARHLLLLDEAHFIGKVVNLTQGVNFSRSKGLSILIASQSLTGLYHVYGKEEAQAILNSCSWQLFLRAEDQTNASLQAQQFGQRKDQDWRYTENFGGPQPSYSLGQDRQMWPVVTDRDFLQLPTPSPRKGFSYYARTPFAQVLRGHMDFKNPLLKWTLLPKRKRRSRRLLRGNEQLVKPWTAADLERLLRGPQQRSQRAQAAQALASQVEQQVVQLYGEALDLLNGALLKLVVTRNPALARQIQNGSVTWPVLLKALATTLPLRRSMGWFGQVLLLGLRERLLSLPRRVGRGVETAWLSLLWPLEHQSVQLENWLKRQFRRLRGRK